jgi:hypothetical protein
MNDDKRRALMEEASRFRERAARRTGQQYFARWDCGRGHAWDDAIDHAQNVRCLSCASQRREIETRRLRDLARMRGGALVSTGYVDAATPLRWECAHGHRWDARADDAERRWCAECARTVYAAYR